MFYYLLEPIMTYNFFLIAAAVIPAIILMVRVWRADRYEKESPWLMWQLVKGGILSSLLAMVEERVCSWILGLAVPENTVLYNVILYFVIVAVAEEVKVTGVTVTALCPGPTATGFEKAAGMKSGSAMFRHAVSAAEVALAGVRAMAKGKALSYPGVYPKLLSFGTRIGPRSVTRKFAKIINH